jgi:nickel/cobalt exporter
MTRSWGGCLAGGALVLRLLAVADAPLAGAAESPAVGEASTSWARAVVAQVAHVQRRMNQMLARQIRLARGGEAGAVAMVLLLSLGYGVVHAAGPGHGKAVVASLFLGREARIVRGIGVGFLISFLQIVSSIAVVALLALGLRHSGLAAAREAVWVEVVSYALIGALGLYLTVVSLAGAPHRHVAEPAGPRCPRRSRPGGPAGRTLILAAGLTPCPSGVIVLLFALANGALAVGIGASLVMALGMGVTVSAIGLLAIATRRAVLHPLRPRALAAARATRILAVAGGLTLTAAATTLLIGAWSRAR